MKINAKEICKAVTAQKLEPVGYFEPHQTIQKI